MTWQPRRQRTGKKSRTRADEIKKVSLDKHFQQQNREAALLEQLVAQHGLLLWETKNNRSGRSG